MAPVVSVVIPCYNQARFLDEAIQSVRQQSHQALDVIVIDDGSTDDTARVAVAYRDIRCLRQVNQGLAAARNAGLRLAHGEYVTFLDSDDRLLPGALEVGVASLQAHGRAAFTVGRYRRIAADGSPLGAPARPQPESDAYASLVRRCWIAMPATVMYRRQVLNQIGGFDRSLRCAEDYDLYLRIAQRWPIVVHDVEVAEYRQHAGTLSRNAERMLRGTLRVLGRHRPGAHATAAHRQAWRARENAVWYFDRLLDTALLDLADRRYATAARELLVFARHLPQHPTYAWRRLVTPLRMLGRARRGRAA